MAAFIKAQRVAAAEKSGAAASVIARSVSAAEKSEAAASKVGTILCGVSEAQCQSSSVAHTLRRPHASVQRRGRLQAAAAYNKRLVPTRGNPRAAQAQRWAMP